jgi:antibiotic biosynthesis monooxygenase (ABM) superfamily enzyme
VHYSVWHSIPQIDIEAAFVQRRTSEPKPSQLIQAFWRPNMGDGNQPFSWLEVVLILILVLLIVVALNALLGPYFRAEVLPMLCERYELFCP